MRPCFSTQKQRGGHPQQAPRFPSSNNLFVWLFGFRILCFVVSIFLQNTVFKCCSLGFFLSSELFCSSHLLSMNTKLTVRKKTGFSHQSFFTLSTYPQLALLLVKQVEVRVEWFALSRENIFFCFTWVSIFLFLRNYDLTRNLVNDVYCVCFMWHQDTFNKRTSGRKGSKVEDGHSRDRTLEHSKRIRSSRSSALLRDLQSFLGNYDTALWFDCVGLPRQQTQLTWQRLVPIELFGNRYLWKDATESSSSLTIITRVCVLRK